MQRTLFVRLFGTNGKVDVDKLSLEAFDVIKKKMYLAGICVTLAVDQLVSEEVISCNEVDMPEDIEDVKKSINLAEIEMECDHKPLSEYTFRMKVNDTIFHINFDLVHNHIASCHSR